MPFCRVHAGQGDPLPAPHGQAQNGGTPGHGRTHQRLRNGLGSASPHRRRVRRRHGWPRRRSVESPADQRASGSGSDRRRGAVRHPLLPDNQRFHGGSLRVPDRSRFKRPLRARRSRPPSRRAHRHYRRRHGAGRGLAHPGQPRLMAPPSSRGRACHISFHRQRGGGVSGFRGAGTRARLLERR